jgi:O-antigen/teichoic acid export membrane protein
MPGPAASEISRQPVDRRLRAHFGNPLYRNAYLLLLSAGSTSLLGFLFWALAARHYSAEDVGLNSAVLSAMMLVSGVCQMGLTNIFVRYLPTAGRATRRVVARSYAATAGLSALAALVVATTSEKWSPQLAFLGHDGRWLVAFVVGTAAWTLFSLQDGVMTGMRQAKWVPIENLLFSLAKIVLLVVVASAAPKSGIYVAWVVPTALSLIPVNLLIFFLIIPRHVVSTGSNRLDVRRVMRFAWGNYVGSLFMLGSTLLLPIVVTNQAGARETAYFFVSWTIATSLQLIALTMTTSLTVEVAFDESKLRHYCRRTTMQALRLVLPAAVVCVIGAPYFLRVFGASYASEGTTLLRLLAVASIPNVIVALGLSVARLQHSGRAILWLQAVQCALTLGLSYVLIGRLGIEGVGVAWLVGQIVVAVWLSAGLLRPILFTR